MSGFTTTTTQWFEPMSATTSCNVGNCPTCMVDETTETTTELGMTRDPWPITAAVLGVVNTVLIALVLLLR